MQLLKPNWTLKHLTYKMLSCLNVINVGKLLATLWKVNGIKCLYYTGCWSNSNKKFQKYQQKWWIIFYSSAEVLLHGIT